MKSINGKMRAWLIRAIWSYLFTSLTISAKIHKRINYDNKIIPTIHHAVAHIEIPNLSLSTHLVC